MRPTPGHVQPDQAPSNHEVDHLMHNVEKIGEQETGSGVLDIEFNAER